MAVTVPTAYAFQQGNRDIVAGEAILAPDVALIRDNTHHHYAALALRPMAAAYWRRALETSSTSAVTLVELPLRFNTNRRPAGLRVMFYRTGTCSLTILLRDANDTTTLASFGPSAGGVGASYVDLTSGITQDDCLLRVQASVSSGAAGLRYLRVSELPLAASNLP